MKGISEDDDSAGLGMRESNQAVFVSPALRRGEAGVTGPRSERDVLFSIYASGL